MIVAPHPDDEAIIAAGIIESAIARGDTVKVVVVTNGDLAGSGYTRQAETVAAMNYLGVTSNHVIFLGYGDRAMLTLFNSPNPTTIYASPAGFTQTYANQGLGNTDYHHYLTGTHAAYTRANLASDLRTVISAYLPSDIYTTAAYDEHGDHLGTDLFVAEALANLVKQQVPNYSPRLHEALVHWSNWPYAYDPATPTPKPAGLEKTSLDWAAAEAVEVPLDMQIVDPALNRKFQTLQRYPTQCCLNNFVRRTEVFWARELTQNLGLLATATASSESAGTGQTAAKVNDGHIIGYPWIAGTEWASQGQLAGAWVRLSWPAPVTIGQIVLHDRPNAVDNVLGGTLTFSDGTSAPVGPLPNNGLGLVVNGGGRTVTWVQFRVDAAAGASTGLSEFEVIGGVPTAPPTEVNVAMSASVTVSSEAFSTAQLGIKAVDGYVNGYPGDYTKEWATAGQLAGAWIQLQWTSPVTVSRVVLYDRPNLSDNILAGSILFSDGTSLSVGQLSNAGNAMSVAFASKAITWVRFRVDGAVGSAIGLAEFEVYGTGSGGPPPPIPPDSNLARSALITASSENTATGQLAIRVADGVKDGYPGDYTKEWATRGQLGGAWLQMQWSTAVPVSQVVLYDRPNLTDNIVSGTLLFSDGTSVLFGQLPNNGAGLAVTFPVRTITWLRVRIDKAVGSGTGLSECEVF